MITKNKVIELFCMTDDFCKFFDAMMEKYTLKPTTKRKYCLSGNGPSSKPSMTSSRIWHKWSIQGIESLIILLLIS